MENEEEEIRNLEAREEWEEEEYDALADARAESELEDWDD